jgi:type II secretory pathway pseudopilin PulG
VKTSNTLRPSAAPPPAFSLVEILVAVGLLSFIILGLLMMFNQTQRAFRLSITQADVLEQGRATMDMMSREIEQTTPSQYPDFFSGAWRRATNFFAEPVPGFNTLVQPLPGSGIRSNVVQQFFFLTRLNQDWIGTGYQVVPDMPGSSIGTLYRFTATNARSAPIMVGGVIFSNLASASRVADGVVHLRARAFDTNGVLIASALGPYGSATNVWVRGNALDPWQAACYFMSNAVPAYVELELGILEPQIVKKSKSIPDPLMQSNFLSGYAAEEHVFRQRIPIRNVDTAAYQ